MPPDAQTTLPLRRSWQRTAGIAFAAIILVSTVCWLIARRPSDAALLAEAQDASLDGRYADASRLAGTLVERHPDSSEYLLFAARADVELGDHNRALGLYDRVTGDGSESFVAARLEAGELLLFKLHRASDAERRFLDVLSQHSDNVTAINRLVHLYSLEGRTHACVDMLYRQIRTGNFTADHLLMIGQRAPFVDSPSVVNTWLESDASDAIPLISRSRIAINENRNRDALTILHRILKWDPEQIEAHALTGRALLATGDDHEFLKWHVALPPTAEAHPMVWLVRGHWAQRREDHATAVRCYWESLKREPQQKSASYQLGIALIACGRSQEAEPFLSHAKQLDELSDLLDHLLTNRQDVAAMRRIASRMESMGRTWEAWGWARQAVAINPTTRWAQELQERIAPTLSHDTPLTLQSHQPGLKLDLASNPLPDWSPSDQATLTVSDPDLEKHAVTFVESAAAVGIDFTYFNGYDGRRKGRFIHEQMGGGVAVLDFDVDGWPDVYFTQGCDWPPQANQRRHLDRLYQNREGESFTDVTNHCGVTEWQYSQGVTIGDFNNDGFPDVFVANIGANRLFENNGDGTFSDATAAAFNNDDWTTSCVLADLNGDTWPDLYAVNYVHGNQVYSKICRDPEGRVRICSPSEFTPSHDRLYVNTGDGGFEEITLQTDIQNRPGNGLGIVAADFDQSGLLSLFVANDQTANFFLHNQTDSRGGQLSLVERGLMYGLAFDQDGLAQACMGVAVGDANGDSLLDMFVTNITRESNTLYVQQQGSGFTDATQRSGLRDGSFAMLGFGTQFLDAELDGLPDLVLTNGHVDAAQADGAAYQMRPQYFCNVGQGRFVERPPGQAGTFFETAVVGRSLARIDWNRDGREEFAVSNLESPAALLKNTTREAGHFLALKFVGIASSRDAIGTSATVTMGNVERTRQLTAGDGYQASNQRQLVFGLGKNQDVDQIEVRWPSGLRQVIRDVVSGGEYLIIEGRPQPFRLPQ